jgi:hypothetical protein
MVDGHGWRREGEVREAACRYRNYAGDSVNLPKHGGTAFRAETVGDMAAIVTDPDEFRRLPVD